MPAAYRRETTYDRSRDSRKNPPADEGNDGCPACSNEGMVGTKYPTVWICERCSAVFGSVADEALTIMKSCDGGQQAAIIGQVTSADRPQVHLRTPMGTTRIVEMPPGEILPRIC